MKWLQQEEQLGKPEFFSLEKRLFYGNAIVA